MNKKDNFEDLANGRYYANPIEQQILIQGLQRYFSLPERSQNRNRIAKEVSNFLRSFSPHWSHRAVRLWFNNNKHTYFGSNEGNPNTNIAIPIANQPIINPQIQKPPPIPQIIQQPQQLNHIPPFIIPIQQSIVPPSNPTISVQNSNNLPIPIQSQTVTAYQKQLQENEITAPSEKANQPSLQIINPPDIMKIKTPPQLPPPINNSNKNTTYPLINSPVYNSHPIPSPNISSNLTLNDQNSTTNKQSIQIIAHPQTRLPAPQIIQRSNSPIHARSPVQVSSPVQVVSPRQTPEKIPLTLPPIKVSEIAPNSNSNSIMLNIKNTSNNSSRNISASPSLDGKNIVSSPITSQKYIMRPPIQIGSKVLFPPIQLEDDSNGSNLKNASSFPSLSSFTTEPIIDQSYANLARLLKSIQDTDETDIRLDQRIIEFDDRINALKSKCYNIEIDRIEPRLKPTRFPFSREPSTEFNIWNQIPESNSNLDILSEFPMRSPSFSHQFFYATDNASVGHGDSFTANNIWQARNYEDTKVPYFECAAFNDDIAAYVHLQLQNQNQRVLSFYNFRSNQKKNLDLTSSYSAINSVNDISTIDSNGNSDINNSKNESSIYSNRNLDRQWSNIVIDCHSRVEAMSVDSNFAWLLADGIVIHASLDQILNSGKVSIPSQYGYISTYINRSAIASSSSSGILTKISDNLDIQQIRTSYRGITSVHSLSSNMIVGVSLSCMPRQLNESGKEVRAFIGHCANVQGIAILSPTSFASRAEDYTVRIWDVRKREAAMTIATLHNSVINISGSSNFVVTAFHNKIGVIDIRGSSGKPILGVTTEDYDAASLNYNQQDDCLAMFGIIEKENNKDSMLFVGGDGQSRQRIFRMYHNFVGIQNE